MTEGQEPRTKRVRLGGELRRLRRLAGLSGRDISDRLGIGQASVSRIENGKALPSLPQVNVWGEAVGASSEQRDLLVALTEAALNEVETWRIAQLRGLPEIQTEVAKLQETARIRRCFQPALVPGLLQTAEYARRVAALVDITGTGDHAGAAARKVERQAILYKEDHQFEFIITEAALRLRICSPPVMEAQLAHIASVATLRNVDISVIPFDADMEAIPWCGFNLYDERGDLEPIVKIELPHGGVTVSDPEDVELYRNQLDVLRRSAVSIQDYLGLPRKE